MGVLPNDEKVKHLNHAQWLWLYFNIAKDEEEEEDLWKARLDYLGWWINPDMARSVAEENKKSGNKKNSQVKNDSFTDTPIIEETEVINGDTVSNTDFEEELKRALAENDEDFAELPSDSEAGNPFESQSEFLNRVLAMQEIADMQNSVNNSERLFGDIGIIDGESKSDIINEEDLDYFEVP